MTSKAKTLDFGASTPAATATNSSGAPTTIDRNIKTVNPQTLVNISTVSVADNVTVGVGMPVG
ncbi:MAG: hypothetical protein IPG68_10680 [Micrococcales bacterium]|nr:hypothetical protein [Micrococcales bacterium]